MRGPTGRVENAARFSTLRTDNRRVDNALLIHRRRWRIEPVTSACARRLPFDDAREDRRPRAGVGRRVENAVRFSTLRTDNRRVDNAPLIHRRHWRIEPVISARAQRLPLDDARADRRSACWRRQTRGKRCAVFHPTHGNRRVDNAPLIHRRRWRIEPVTSACARRLPFDDAREDRRPRAGAGRRVENAARFSTLRTDNHRVDNAPLIHRRHWRIEPVTSACARRLPLDDARADRRSACWRRQTRGKRCAVFHPTRG